MGTYQIPLQAGAPQTFNVTLGGVTYQMTLQYRNDALTPGWILDIADQSGNAIASGIPLVTGCNLLGQYKHLGFGGGLFVQTPDDLDAVPTFQNLGSDAFLYWVTAS